MAPWEVIDLTDDAPVSRRRPIEIIDLDAETPSIDTQGQSPSPRKKIKLDTRESRIARSYPPLENHAHASDSASHAPTRGRQSSPWDFVDAEFGRPIHEPENCFKMVEAFCQTQGNVQCDDAAALARRQAIWIKDRCQEYMNSFGLGNEFAAHHRDRPDTDYPGNYFQFNAFVYGLKFVLIEDILRTAQYPAYIHSATNFDEQIFGLYLNYRLICKSRTVTSLAAFIESEIAARLTEATAVHFRAHSHKDSGKANHDQRSVQDWVEISNMCKKECKLYLESKSMATLTNMTRSRQYKTQQLIDVWVSYLESKITQNIDTRSAHKSNDKSSPSTSSPSSSKLSAMYTPVSTAARHAQTVFAAPRLIAPAPSSIAPPSFSAQAQQSHIKSVTKTPAKGASAKGVLSNSSPQVFSDFQKKPDAWTALSQSVPDLIELDDDVKPTAQPAVSTWQQSKAELVKTEHSERCAHNASFYTPISKSATFGASALSSMSDSSYAAMLENRHHLPSYEANLPLTLPENPLLKRDDDFQTFLKELEADEVDENEGTNTAAEVTAAAEAIGAERLPDNKYAMPGLKCTLHPHQVIGVAWMCKREERKDDKGRPSKVRGGILADAMGLGKTVQTLGVMIRNQAPRRTSEQLKLKTTLIVCPVALI